MKTTVRETERPVLYKALGLLLIDNGGEPAPVFQLHASHEEADKAEAALAQLSADELDTFVTGDQDDQAALVLAKLNQGIDLTDADRILENFFDM